MKAEHALDDELLALLLEDDSESAGHAGADSEADRQSLVPRGSPGVPAALSFGQRQLWLHQKIDPRSTAYNLVRAFRLKGKLDPHALEKALQGLVERHAVLRTRFAEQDGEPVQIVQSSALFHLKIEDLAAAEDAAELLDERLELASRHVFDLSTAPQLFARLFRLAGDEHVLVLGMHHIVSDGWSNNILLRDLALGYRQTLRTDGSKPVSSDLPQFLYADYAEWQREHSADAGLETQRGYWRDYLQDVPPLSMEGMTGPLAKQAETRDARCRFDIPVVLSARVDELCRAQGLTPFVAYFAVWQVLLGRYSRQPDFAVGVPHAGRGHEELHDIVGFFVTLQAYRARLQPSMSWVALCRQVRNDTMAALGNADVALEIILEESGFERSGPGGLFQAMFGLEVEDEHDHSLFDGLEIEAVPAKGQGAKAGIALDVVVNKERVHAILECDGETGGVAFAESAAKHYLQLLEAMVAAPGAAIGSATMFSEVEHRALTVLGDNPIRYPWQGSVLQGFEQHVGTTPDSLALVCDDLHLSYVELNARANRLAHCLIAYGVGAETRVGLALGRTADLVVGVLAILKSGAAYLALDPAYPGNRLLAMAQDSAISVMLTTSDLRENLPAVGAALELDRLDLRGFDVTNPQLPIHPRQLAYVIYTSGSTGRPKGIAVEHASLAEHAEVAIGYFSLSAADRVLLFSTVNFDGFVEQLFPALAIGAAVVMRGGELWDSRRFYLEVIEQGITVADLSTAYWFLLAQDFALDASLHGRRSYGRLRQVHATGEAMPAEGMKAWADAGLAGIKLLNNYGPTETIVSASSYDCSACVRGDHAMPPATPIGRPLAGRSFHILDAELNPVAPGFSGELCIGGDLLARGYQNRAALNAERFIADPFDSAGGRLYRTGDLVRWREDGELLYLGRIDHQVKVRGFRIELGEVEAQLLQLPGVREAVAIVADGRLLAYVGTNSADPSAETAWKQRLAGMLPEYMVPARIVSLAALPLSPAGKIDRHALPRPQFDEDGAADLPLAGTESALAALWCNVLGLARIGRSRDFFALGGNSLAALRLLRQIQLRFGEGRMTLADIFNHPTLPAQAALLDDVARKPCEVVMLNREGKGIPLFCFPGLNVNSSEYEAMVASLGQDRPVHAFVSHALTDERWLGLSLEALAARYAGYIRSNVADGPCTLLGWSFGGDLAYETARQLAGTVDVSLVCMIDVFEPMPLPQQDSAAQEIAFPGSVTAWLERSAMAGRWDELFGRMSAMERCSAMAYLDALQEPLPLDGPDLSSGEYSLWVAFENVMMMEGYRHVPLAAPVHAYLAQASLSRREPGLRDWEQHAASVRKTIIDGVDHRSILTAPAFTAGLKADLLALDAT